MTITSDDCDHLAKVLRRANSHAIETRLANTPPHVLPLLEMSCAYV